MMREIQTDPVDDSLIHADFLEIDLEAPRAFSVNVEFAGVAKGVDRGGELVVHNAVVLVKGLPLEIPDVISVDVSDLDIDENILFADIKLPENVKMDSDGTILCVEVVSAAVAAAAAAAAEAAASVDEAPAAEADASAGEDAGSTDSE
jgi:large subunit ribosomal protein L25